MEFTAVPSVSPAAPERAARRKGTQAVLEVRGKTRLSPRLLRVTLGGEQYSELRRNHHTDAYVKLLIASEESGLLPPYDLDAIRASAPEHLPRSEEHTSELQSRGHLVCRLLLEKKKTHSKQSM